MSLLLYSKKKPATAVCESDTDNDALMDVLYSTETTEGVPQSEKATTHSRGATPTNAYPETDGT